MEITKSLVERISGIVNIYEVNAPNLEYVKVTVGNECPKIYSDHHALIVKYVVPPSISLKRCFTTKICPFKLVFVLFLFIVRHFMMTFIFLFRCQQLVIYRNNRIEISLLTKSRPQEGIYIGYKFITIMIDIYNNNTLN